MPKARRVFVIGGHVVRELWRDGHCITVAHLIELASGVETDVVIHMICGNKRCA